MSERTNERDRVRLCGLRVQAIIGVHAQERTQPQCVQFDIDATTDVRAAALHDDFGSGAIDYGRLRAIAVESARSGQFRLVESLAETVARRICLELDIDWVRVQAGKPDAYADVDLVAVVIERSRTDYC